MKTKNIFAVVICLALGFSILGCAKLNPKTEGQIFSALQAKQDAFKKCYEAALEADREAKGPMKLELKFDPSSVKPEEVVIASSKIESGDMQKCVKKAAKGIKIEDAPGVFVNGNYTVVFTFE